MTFSNGQLTGMTSATALPSIPAGCFVVCLQAESQNVRFTVDGSTPSTSNGFVLVAGQPPVSWSGNVANLKFKQEASDAILNYAYGIDRTAI